MGLLVILIPFLIWLGIAIYLEIHSRDDYETSLEISGGLSFFVVVIMIISNLSGYYNHIKDIEKFNVIEDRISIYEDRLDKLNNEVRTILIDSYGNHEKDIFNNMSPEGLSLLLVKYPELRASETFIHATDELIGFNDAVYKRELERVDLKRSINTRLRSPFIFTFLLPKH